MPIKSYIQFCFIDVKKINELSPLCRLYPREDRFQIDGRRQLQPPSPHRLEEPDHVPLQAHPGDNKEFRIKRQEGSSISRQDFNE